MKLSTGDINQALALALHERNKDFFFQIETDNIRGFKVSVWKDEDFNEKVGEMKLSSDHYLNYDIYPKDTVKQVDNELALARLIPF